MTFNPTIKMIEKIAESEMLCHTATYRLINDLRKDLEEMIKYYETENLADSAIAGKYFEGRLFSYREILGVDLKNDYF